MPPSVDHIHLGSDLQISRVLTGLWQIADMERDGHTVDPERAAAAMQSYAQAGLSTFDMADHYGSAELVAGRFHELYDRGGNAQFLTKWVPKPGPITRDDARAAVERACARLGVKRIDLLQFHTWAYDDPSWLDALFFLQELKNEGLIRHLGLTNFDTAHLRVALASGIDIVSNQICFSLLDRRAAHEMTAYCLAHDIRLLAYGTVAGGWLTEQYLGKEEPDWESTANWSKLKYGRFIRAVGGWEALQRLLRAVAAVARRHGVSMANVASRFVLEQPAVGGVIIGARLGVSEHIDDTLRLFSFALRGEDRAAIEHALETLQPLPGDCGDEYRRPPFLTATGDLSHHLATFPPPYETRRLDDGRSICLSGTPWESVAGYARAVRRGNRIVVSGTTATHGDRLIGGNDPAAQAHFVIDKIEGALRSLGGRLSDVLRTRVFVRSMVDWEAIARAHGERFEGIRPANTLIRADLVGEDYLLEMEAEAEIVPQAS